MQKADSEEKVVPRVHFAALALVSFILSFVVARSFTYFYPSVVLVSGNLHIHHFWFGLALLAIGGWLGISYNHKEIDRLAAIIYGVGGGLIADEVGLLLTFGDYWSGITWTFVVVLVASVSVLILLGMYRRAIFEELHNFVSNKASLYIGIFLAAISIAFVVDTDILLNTVVFAGLTVAAILMITAYFIHRMRSL
ncbi:MAG: hypothetical protein LUQ38_00265 [Methanotrichaceae archaeon]|nr:hypothetical protein [Methanotrichaceae archaeon]